MPQALHEGSVLLRVPSPCLVDLTELKKEPHLLGYVPTAFEKAADPTALCAEMSRELTARLRAAPDPERDVAAVVEELKSLGHPLVCFDASDEFEMWCGDWTIPAMGPQLVIDFTYAGDEDCRVEVTLGRRTEPLL